MIKVRYVGLKERRADTVAGTGTVWIGHGDVQDVPDAAWPKLSKHPDIWERVDADVGLESVKVPEAPPTKVPSRFALQHADGSVLDLADLDDDALKQFVVDHGLEKVDLRKKGDARREAIFAEVQAAKG
jgi:hypothetical protein